MKNMNRNIKRMFLVVSLLILLVGIGAVSAGEVTDDSNSIDVDDTPVITEDTTPTSTDNTAVEASATEIKKEEKNIKKEVIDGIDYNHIYENQNINNYFGVYDGNSYFNNCTFNSTSGTYYLYSSIITLNDCKVLQGNLYGNELRLTGNNEVNLSSAELGFERIIGNLTISDCTFNSGKNLPGNFTIENSIINSTLNGKNYGNLTIGENVTLTDNAKFDNFVNIYSDNFEELIPHLTYLTGNLILEDQTIVNQGNKGNLTLTNSVINSQFENMANSNITLINSTINNSVNNANNANMYVMNSTINGIIDNYGNLTIDNTAINKMILNKGNLTIGDNVTFCDDFKIYGTGEIVTNDSEKIAPYLESYNLGYIEVTNFNSFKNALKSSTAFLYNDVYKIKLLEGTYSSNQWEIVDMSPSYINKTLIIEGNNQIINAKSFSIQKDMEYFIINNLTMNFSGLNNANGILEVNNCTINTSISNQGTLIIDDNSIIDTKAEFWINNIIINDINRILPYTTRISNVSIENFTFTRDIQFYGNSKLSNCTVDSAITNNGNLTLNNTNLNKAITNEGNITIINCSIDENSFRISGNGDVTCDDLAKYFPYITYVKGEYELNDYIINKSFTNNGQITLNNCIMNSSITNNGILIINDETVLGENLVISGEGEIIINDTNKIAPYLSTYNGDYTIENMTINTIKRNLGKLTIINSTINSRIINTGNLTIKNSTINSRINNNGNLTITDDCIIGENCQIAGNGQLIMNDTTRVGIYSGNIIKDNTVLNSSITIPNNGNVTFTNSNITAPITNKGNLTFTNCLINAQITNYANLTLNNCSLSNNNMSVSGSKIDGFLINNQGKSTLVDCRVENNTFNSTSDQLYLSNYPIIGAIANKANMSVLNCTFYNNSVGYAMITDKDEQYSYDYGVYCGDASCIYNNGGNLSINNSIFKDNYAGKDAGAILSTNNYTDYYHRNLKSEANLLINNTKFVNNTATGSGGALVLSDKNNHIINCEFTENQIVVSINAHDAHMGGAIEASNGTLIINNTTFTNNKFITESQSWVSNIGSIIHSNTYVNITIDNSKFNNDIEGTLITEDIKITSSYLNNTRLSTSNNYQATTIINNNTFTNNSSLSITTSVQNELNNLTITNNLFQDNNYTSDSIQITNAIDYESIANKINNTYIHTGLNDTLTLNTPSKVYAGEPITITGTYSISNPEYYDENILEQNKYEVYINGQLYQTIDDLEFTVTPTNGNMIVTVQPTISSTRKTVSIRATTLTNITITPENYNEYIYEGVLIGVGQNSKITFQGDFTDKGEIYIDTSDLLIDGSNATFTNTELILDAGNIVIQNMKINNTNTKYPIANYKDNNTITNNTITLNNPNSNATAIYNAASNTIIANNTITVEALPGSVDWNNPEGGVADTQAILLLGGDKNTIQNNNINIKSTAASGYNTLEAITNNNGATNTLITQNNITISNAAFNYAIDSINNVENITITENTITVTGERYCDGIQTGNNAKNILIDNNNITCTCINTTEMTMEGAITYGIIGTMLGGNGANNITITNNNIELTGTANYGIELYWVDTTEIHNNNITVNGPYSMGIGYAYSPNGKATQNTITITGDSTTPINQITEEFKPENVGIRIQNGTQNVYLENNTITTSDVGGKDTTINTDESNVTIKNNQLISSQGYGDETVKTYQPGVIMENNVIETTITIDDITTLINTQTTLTASVTTINGDKLNSGTVTFTDSDGNTIAEATITDGTATATVTFTQTGESTITATYTPTSTGLSTSQATATITVEEPQTQITIDEVTAKAGETITLTARVTDQMQNNLNGGKITFKVNGKTVKDANGKVVYAKVVDGVATVQYTVADNMNGKNLNITATYSGTNKYNKATATITTTVEKATPTLTTESVTATAGSTIQLKANITDGDKVINTGKVVFKINGKSVKDERGKVIYAKVINNQVILNYTLPSDMKSKDYNITAVFICPDYDRLEDTKILTVN